MKAALRRLPPQLLFLLIIFGIIVGILTVFRLVMFVANVEAAQLPEGRSLAWAFWMGFHFDAMVASYFMALPFALLAFDFWFDVKRKSRLFKFVKIYCLAVVLLSLLICAIDIPYFKFFNSRLTTAIVVWKDNIWTNLRLGLSNPQTYLWAVAAYFAIKMGWKWMNMLWKHCWLSNVEKRSMRAFFIYAGAASLLFLGFRGSLMKPIELRDAFQDHSSPLVNNLALNPVHTYFQSYFNEFAINVMSDTLAIERVRRSLNIERRAFKSPIARQILPSNSKKYGRPNVVLILMESFSSRRMGLFGHDRALTPTLDTLCQRGLFWENFYSWGIHTYNGIFSTLYGLPAQLLTHPMSSDSDIVADQFWGLPNILKEKNYQTAFFVTHDPDFDNIQNFIPNNGFEYLFSRKDYPPSDFSTAWGVDDHKMFEFGLAKIDQMAASPKPFFATLLTITNHPPYKFPLNEPFQPKPTLDPRDAALEYADWAVGHFFEKAQKRPWFDNTVFVLLGDHGVNRPGVADVPLAYNHVPLLIYQPSKLKPKRFKELGSQIDVLATVMGLLGEPYIDNSLGIDLLGKRQRPFVFFTQDNKICILDQSKMYVYRTSGKESLYDYRTPTGDDILSAMPVLADTMRRYALPQIQVAQWMRRHQMTGKSSLVRSK